MMIILIFEVMDKIPSNTEIWLSCFIAGLIGFFLCRYKVWLIMPVVIFNLLFSLLLLSDDNDEFIRRAIIQEAGENYYRNSYPAIIFAIALPIFGILLNVRSQNKQQRA
jgi:hypothetical protein